MRICIYTDALMNIDAFKEMAGKAPPREGAWAKPHANKLFRTKLAAIHGTRCVTTARILSTAKPSSRHHQNTIRLPLAFQLATCSENEASPETSRRHGPWSETTSRVFQLAACSEIEVLH